ncbi:VOC family protein [Actibacterium sp. 188UL27-1]|nr:VOC family protein [Actibacterium sp. 188UL27-1]
MDLGAFSLSLNVSDLDASRAFYEKLGFGLAGGSADQGWLILRNGGCTLGLFQGHLPENCLTFNPGWTPEAQAMETFEDVRRLQARLESQGIEIFIRAKEGTAPTHFVVVDPDGNQILIDQHENAPE